LRQRERSGFRDHSGRRLWGAAHVLALVLALTACTSAPPQTSTTVRVLGAWSGAELDNFLAVLAPFEQRTGIKVLYSSTRDLRGVIADGLARGDPPDLAGLEGPGHLQELARAGSLRDLAQAIDVTYYKQSVAPTFVELGSSNSRLVGLFVKATVKGLIWYDPQVMRAGVPQSFPDLNLMATQTGLGGATREWCVGLESKASSGWPGTDWIESFLLHRSGPDAYDRWVAGDLAWTSSEVRSAFQAFGQIVADDAVAGGSDAVLRTNFATAGEPLFTSPPGCLFMMQGSFMPAFFEADGHRPGVDFDFFPFPEIVPAFQNTVIGAGDLMSLFTDNPAARQLLSYLVTEEAQQRFVAGGGALSVNREVSLYPSDLARREAAVLSGAEHFRFDASDMMPAAMNKAFWQAVLDFTADQSKLDVILRDLEAVRGTAHG